MHAARVGAGKKILVVDDEAGITELLNDVLLGEGYAVDAAPNATRALDLVRKSHYDAAILDYNLPDMNGVTLHRQVCELDQTLGDRTLFTSGLEQSEQHMKYYSLFGKGFLQKPFEVSRLLESLDSMWSGKSEP